jgi:chromosome segregation ATPase
MSMNSIQQVVPTPPPVEVDEHEAFQRASEEISGYFQTQQVSFADYMAVISDLRRSGRRPDTVAISQGLRELASTEGRESRRKRNENRDSKIVHLTAHETPDGENLARRVHQYESDLEEATRQVEAANNLRAEIEDLRSELAAASRRESELTTALRAAEAKSGQEAFLQQELNRLKTLISNRDARTDFEFVRGRSTSVSLPVETEALHREITRLREALDEVLAMEEFFRQQWEQVSGDVECMAVLEAEISSLSSRLEEARIREQELTARLGESHGSSHSLEELTSRLIENEALIAELRNREASWVEEREQDAARTRETLESLRHDLEQAQLAVADAQHREAELQSRLAELQAAPPTISPDGESERLAGELTAARQDLADKDARCLTLEARIDELLPTVSAYEELYQRHTQLSARLERLPALQKSAQAARSTLSRIAPVSLPRSVESQLDTVESLAVTLEAVNAAAACCESEFAALRDALAVSQKAPVVAEPAVELSVATTVPTLPAVAESGDLKRILVEVIEIELEKQRKANASLASREIALRSRLETARPRSIEARTAEEELHSQAAFRNDMKQRADTLTELLRTLVASLRDASA